MPVYVDGTYLENSAEADQAERGAYRAMFAELHRANGRRKNQGLKELSVGSVHAYVFTPDGGVLDSRHVGNAGPKSVIEMLEEVVRELKVSAGEPIVAPSSQAPRPDSPADALVLHLTARYLVPRSHEEARRDLPGDFVPLAPRLGAEQSGQWTALPSEDWLVLPREQWTRLLPKARVAPGNSWQVEKALADRLLTHFYPTTELNDLTKNRIDDRSLTLTVLDVEGDRVRARIDGHLTMKHPFYPGRDDNNFVKATLVGLIEFDRAQPRVHSLHIVTDQATYGGNVNGMHYFGVAVRTVP